MASKNFTSADNLTVKRWASEFMSEMPRQCFFLSRFSGDFLRRNGLPAKEQKQYLDSHRGVIDGGGNSIVHAYKDFKGREPGDKLTVGFYFELDENSGVTEGQTLEDNESDISTDDYSITLAQYRNATRSRSRMARKRTYFKFDEVSKNLLYNWAAQKIDNVTRTTLLAAPTEIYYYDGVTDNKYELTGTAATAKAALSATTSKFTPAMVSLMYSAALTGRDGQRPKLAPLMIDGTPWFVALVHTDVKADMLRNTEWINIVNSAWQGKGKDHPLFKDAICTYNNVIIHGYEKMPIATDGGAGAVPWSHGKFLGADAIGLAFGTEPYMVMETFDYTDQVGYAIDFDFGVAKPQFTDPSSSFTFDNGQFSFYVSRTQQSDITLA